MNKNSTSLNEINDVFFSVIIPVDNSDNTLVRCLDSIVNQTFDNFEIICVNNNSSDNSLNILKEYIKKSNIRIINVINKSINDLRNIGFKYSNGKYVLFMDSSDWLDLDAFDLLFKKLKTNIDICMFPIVGFDEDYFYEDGYYGYAGFDEDLKNRIFDYNDILDILFLIPTTPCNKIYSSNFLKENNLMFLDNSYFDENLFFFNVVFVAENMIFLDEKIYCKSNIIENDSFKCLKDIIDYSNSLLRLFKKFGMYNECINELLNFKISIIKYWFYLMDDEEKKSNFYYVKTDFEMIEGLNDFSLSKIKLSVLNQDFFNRIINSSNIFEYETKEYLLEDIAVNKKNSFDLNYPLNYGDNTNLQIKHKKLLHRLKMINMKEHLFEKKYDLLLKRIND